MPSHELINRKEFIQKMGEDLGTVYFFHYNQIIWVNSRWRMYKTLFNKSDKRIEILNNTADVFFKILWKTLFDDIVLQIANLTDKKTTKVGRRTAKENMTIGRFSDIVDDAIKPEIKKLVNIAEKKATFAKEWRDKYLAHYDYDYMKDPKNHPLPDVDREKIDEAMIALEKLMNTINAYYCNAESLMFFFEAEDVVDRLVYFLQKGWRAEQEWKERMESGNILPGDLNFTDDS